MTTNRMEELLKNAITCFEEMRSPFSHTELSEHNVTSDECGDLSEMIANRLKSSFPFDEPYTLIIYLASLLRVLEKIKDSEKIAASFGMDYVKMSLPELGMIIKTTDDINQSVLFLMNFVRLDTLRQVVETGDN